MHATTSGLSLLSVEATATLMLEKKEGVMVEQVSTLETSLFYIKGEWPRVESKESK
ncbi:uncharacterized protein DS421_3g77070 [Arachis hypogaea]|nr:uncharacterized protein DS421_3g77070 [Arachis hypogaea]